MIAVATSIHIGNPVCVRVAEHSTDSGDFVALVLADDEVGRDVMVVGAYDDIHAIAHEAVAELERFGREAGRRS